MARNSNIKLRRSATFGAIPTTSNLDLGELALNTYDGKLYMKTTESSLDSIVQVGSATDSYHKVRKSQTLEFEVKVQTKTSDHAWHGSGSSSAYSIDGIESPHLHLVPGNTYRFDQSDSSNSGHPLRFYYEADKTTAYTTGVTTSGTPGSSGAYTQIIPTDDTPMVLHYQCSAHGYMGGRAEFSTRNFTGFDTADLTEGTNQYFTNARARSAISVSGDLSYNSSTGVISFSETTAATTRALISVTDAGGDGSLAYNNSTGVITYTGPSAAEVRAHFSAGTGVAISNGAVSIGQAVATTSNVTFNNVTVDGTLTSDDITSTNISIAGNATVTGNLTVSGTTTSINTATLDVEDKNITLNYGSGDTSSTADGAGITIQDAESSSVDATILWDSTNDQFDFSHPITITNNSTSSDALLLESTEASSSAAPILAFKRHSGSPADADYLGQLKFKGENDADQDVVYAKITAKIQDASDGSEDGIIEFANRKAGSNTITARLRSDSFQLLNNTNLVVAGLTYPTSDGTNGQAIVTDGSGNLSFSTISGGGGGTVTEAFKNILVSGQSNIVADSATDSLTFSAGSNITLTTNASTDTITIAASGGEVTVQEEGSSLSTAATTLNFVGAGVTASGSGATKTITVPQQDLFSTVAVSGQTNIVADSATDTLTFAAGSGISLTTDASTDTVTITNSGSSSAASDTLKRFVYTTSSSTTAFTGSDDNSQSLSYTSGAVQVYLNGVLQKLTTDYAETNSTTITFVNAVPSGNVVEIVAFYRTIGTGNSVVNQFTGDGSTTAFTVTTAPVSENNLLVYIDGVYQQKTDYAVSGTTLTMDTAPASGAIIETVCSVGAITEQGALTLTDDLTVSDGSRTLLYDVSAGELNHSGATLNINKTNGVDVAIGSDDFYVDASTSRVGIGTTSPQAPLHVSHASAPNFRLSRTGTGQIYQMGIDSSGRFLIEEAASEGGTRNARFVIDDSGEVGIGTGAPAVSLDIGSLTDAIRVPNGTTAQRPTAAAGQIRYNTTTSEFEGYAAGAWGKIGGGGDSFGTIAVSGQSNVVADQENDTLTLEAGSGITLTTDASYDKVTIAGGSGSVFTTDLFTASGSGSALLAYTLSKAPSSEDELICFIEGVYQNKNSYALSGTTLTFDSGIVSGQEIVVHHIGAGVVGQSPTIDTFTGDGSTTAYTLSFAPPNENYLSVFWNGVYQHHSEYSVSGTTLTFTAAAPNSAAIEVHIPTVNGIGTPSDATVTPAKLSTGGPSWDTNSNQIVGSHYTRSDSTSVSSTSATTVATHAIATFRSVNYKVQITQGTDYYQSEINVVHDGSTAYITEFGIINTDPSNFAATFSATISSGNLLLQVAMGSNASATIKVLSVATTV